MHDAWLKIRKVLSRFARGKLHCYQHSLAAFVVLLWNCQVHFAHSDFSMAARSAGAIFVEKTEFDNLAGLLNLRQTQIQDKFTEVDNALTRLSQMAQTLDQAHGGRITDIESSMTEVFSEVGNHQSEFTNMKIRLASQEDAIQRVDDVQQHMIGNQQGEITQIVARIEVMVAQITFLNSSLGEADNCVRNLNRRLEAVENNGPSGPSEPRGDKKGLLDPRIMTVTVFDATKLGDYVGWRDIFENMVNEVHPGLKEALNVLRREKTKISEELFDKILAEANIRVPWSYRRVSHELGLYLVSKLGGKAKTTAESASLSGGFEMYRLVTKKYDNITADTEGLMLSEITKFSGKQSKDVGELSDRLTSLVKAVECYGERTGKSIDESLMGSILTAMLDAKTKPKTVRTSGLILENVLGRFPGPFGADCVPLIWASLWLSFPHDHGVALRHVQLLISE